MADLDAQLAISVDSTGVEAGIGRAKRTIASVGPAAAEAGKAASRGLETMGDGLGKADAKMQRDAARFINTIQRATAAAEAGSRSSSRYFETLAQQRGIDVNLLRPYLQQLDAVEKRTRGVQRAVVDLSKVTTSLGATPFAKDISNATTSLGATGFGQAQEQIRQQLTATGTAARKAGVEFNQYGLSTRQTAAALRQVPAQLTDIITSLQGGQAPLTVLLQQGGQLRDLFGGIAPAAKALGGALLGLINPYTVVAAGALALTTAYIRGSREAEGFTRALVLSGNAAGVTTGQLQQMAVGIDAITGTQAKASAALAEIAATGAVSAANLERFTLAALQLERVGGDAVTETAKRFGELRKAPLDAAIKLNESTNFLTRSVYEQIRALEEQGRTVEAAAVAQRAYADAIQQRAPQIEASLGSIERGWRAIKSAASEALDAVLSVGRQVGPEAQLSAARQTLASLEDQLGQAAITGGPTDDLVREVTLARERVSVLQETVKLGQSSAQNAAQEAAATKAKIEFDKQGEQFLSQKLKMEREITQARELGRQAGLKSEEIDKRVAAIRESYAKKGPDTSRVDSRAQTLLEIEQIQQAAARQVSALSNAERIIEALRAASIVDERAYYAEKRRLIEDSTQVQIAALQAENDRLNAEKLNRKDSLDRDRRVLENQARIAQLQAEASTQNVILTVQETAAVQARTQALISARQAAEDYLAVQERQQQRDLEGIGQGQRQREFSQAIGQIEDRYASQRRDLENQRALATSLAGERGLTAEVRQQFEDRLRLIDEFEQKSINSYRAYYDELEQRQRDWSLGAQEALINYFDESQNVFQQVEEAVSSAFRGMEDALVKFVTTGKLDFKSLADSIIADITRIIIKQQILGPLARSLGLNPGGGAAGGFFDSLFGPRSGGFGTGAGFGNLDLGGFFANGAVLRSAGLSAYSGQVVNKPTIFPFARGVGLMGEAGPEAILPLKRGSDGKLGVDAGGGQPPQVTINFAVQGSVDRRSEASIGKQVAQRLARVQQRWT